VYAAPEFNAAAKALADAEASIANKKYQEAKNSAIQAKEKAEAAKQAAVKNRDAAKAKANTVIGEADTRLSAAAQALAGAPKGKAVEKEIGQLGRDLDQATSLLAQAKERAESEDYYAAAANAEKVSAEARRIEEAVKAAKENLAKAGTKAKAKAPRR
jgi:predicted S18 family serine protease